jgi:hypothetical protein
MQSVEDEGWRAEVRLGYLGLKDAALESPLKDKKESSKTEEWEGTLEACQLASKYPAQVPPAQTG